MKLLAPIRSRASAMPPSVTRSLSASAPVTFSILRSRWRMVSRQAAGEEKRDFSRYRLEEELPSATSLVEGKEASVGEAIVDRFLFGRGGYGVLAHLAFQKGT